MSYVTQTTTFKIVLSNLNTGADVIQFLKSIILVFYTLLVLECSTQCYNNKYKQTPNSHSNENIYLLMYITPHHCMPNRNKKS